VQRRVITQLENALAQLPPRQRSRDTLRARAESVLSTLAGVRCAILIANNWGRYVHLNDRAIALTGYSEAELRRSSVWDLTPGVDLAAARQMWRGFLHDGRMQGSYVIQHKDGRGIPVEFVAIANVLPGLHVSALLPARRRAAPLV
jgi:PAS domain S-box-containing protein